MSDRFPGYAQSDEQAYREGCFSLARMLFHVHDVEQTNRQRKGETEPPLHLNTELYTTLNALSDGRLRHLIYVNVLQGYQ
jgi:hypothetical protein